MSTLVFNITEVPEGESRRLVSLDADDFDLSPCEFLGAELDIEFYRTQHFIRVHFLAQANIELICDRSLDPFEYPINTEYDIVFKTDVQEETEDEEGAVRRFNFSSNTLSIEEEVRDSILLNVPMQKIHPRYVNDDGTIKDFETETFGDVPEDEDEQPIDPRWESLKKLKD